MSSTTEELIHGANQYASAFTYGHLIAKPKRALAVVMCMDARMRAYGILGLEEGDAHIIRNAGGIVTEDVIRSLVVSQRLLETREIVLIHHTDCGMAKFEEHEMRDQIESETGVKPEFAFETFDDLDANVRQSIVRVKSNPFIPYKDAVSGFVYEVETGKLRQVID